MSQSNNPIVDGKEVSQETFQELCQDPKKKVVKLEENVYKTKQMLEG